jgi:peptidoglycan/LPS O-acetylase OafA/YrhL
MQQSNNSTIQYLKQLDGFRWWAVASVMVSHFATTDAVARLPLGYGVLFFFVLSSFLITRILLTSKTYNETSGIGHSYSLRQFYLRRFLRIFPIYYLLLLALYVLNWHPCRQIIEYLATYTINFKLTTGYDAGSFNHLWSLAVEEQFYIFFPFIVYFIQTRYLLRILILFVIIGVAGRAGLYLHNSENIAFSNFHTISCLDSLGVGGILAYLSIYKKEYLKRIISNRFFFGASVLGFLTIMVLSFTMPDQHSRYNFISIVFMRFSFNLMSFWLLGWATTISYKGIAQELLENKLIVYLGRISYGLYLYHLFVPTLVRIIFTKFNITFLNLDDPSFAVVMLYIITTIAIASVSWYIVEKPLNGLKRFFEYNKRSVSLASKQMETAGK